MDVAFMSLVSPNPMRGDFSLESGTKKAMSRSDKNRYAEGIRSVSRCQGHRGEEERRKNLFDAPVALVLFLPIRTGSKNLNSPCLNRPGLKGVPSKPEICA